MRVRLHKWLIVISLVICIGGHWAFLQSVAWARMLVSYSHQSTIGEALEKTFGGKHPCRLCKAVREGRAAEKKQEMLKLETKLEFSFTPGTAWLFPPRPCRECTSLDAFPLARFEAPPLPPPRSA